MDLVRVEQYATELLSKTWTDPATDDLVDPGTVTVDISRLDGTVLVTGAATSGAGAAARTYNLTQTTLLDSLQVTWTSSTYGPRRPDVVEVTGGFLFTVTELQTRLTAGQFTTAQITEMRTTVEQEIEKACGCAFAPRYALETLDGSGGRSVMLRPLVTSIRSVVVDGTAYSAGDLAAMSISTTGSVYSATRAWTAGYSNVLVGYEHGFSDTPAGIRQAALILAKTWLTGQRSPIDDRAITFSTNDAGSYSLAVPGRNGSHFGVPEVDATVDRYNLSTGIA